MNPGRIVCVGASAGGVRALQSLASQLKPDFAAPILVVQHVGSYRSILPALLTRYGSLPASHAIDGEKIRPGHIYVAPPDFHMMVTDETIQIEHGPRENHTRPAIDPLFRSAAVSCGPRVVGVVLTGHLDDGTAGLQEIKRCGGVVVVQDPDNAEVASMPLSALAHVDVDYRVKLEEMGALLTKLALEEVRDERASVPQHAMHEIELTLGRGVPMKHLEAIGKPSTYTCPDCSGSLWEIRDTDPLRFRCHTGHAFSVRSLLHAHSDTTDNALWSALRALQERESLMRTMAEGHRGAADPVEAARLHQEADEMAHHAKVLRSFIENVPQAPQ